MKRIIGLLLALVLLLSGCKTAEAPYTPTGNALGEETVQTLPQANADIALSLAYYPDRSLNPYTCTDATNRAVLSLLYQGLLIFSVKPSNAIVYSSSVCAAAMIRFA